MNCLILLQNFARTPKSGIIFCYSYKFLLTNKSVVTEGFELQALEKLLLIDILGYFKQKIIDKEILRGLKILNATGTSTIFPFSKNSNRSTDKRASSPTLACVEKQIFLCTESKMIIKQDNKSVYIYIRPRWKALCVCIVESVQRFSNLKTLTSIERFCVIFI